VPTGRLDEDHFLLNIITTSGGVITLVVTVDEARSVVKPLTDRPGAWQAILHTEPVPLASVSKPVLRVLLVNDYGESLAKNAPLIGHDEFGGSWAIRTQEVVSIRVVDPDEVPEPPSQRQIGFRADAVAG